MTSLRKKMIDDMKLAGLAPRTQQVYIKAVERLANHFGRSPAILSEEEVKQYLIGLIDDQNIARGTFKTANYGNKFLFVETLGRTWDLFSKKRFESPSRRDFPRFSPTRRLDGFLAL